MDGLLADLRSVVGPGHVVEVDDVQAAWVAYADKECSLSGLKFEGGTLRGPDTGLCLVDLTESRIRQLQADLTEWRRGRAD